MVPPGDVNRSEQPLCNAAVPLSKTKRRLFLAATVVIAILIILAACEILVRVKEALLSKGPRLDYRDALRSSEEWLGPGGFLKENFSGSVVDGYGGTVRWKNNSEGFRSDMEYSLEPGPGVLRILSLGDSFTAGYRVAQEETYSYLLEQWVNQQTSYGPAEVLISCIEHPATGLYYLAQYGRRYHPHIVLLGITLGNDLAGVYAALHERGKYLLTIEGDQVQIALNPVKDKIGFRHGLEVYDIPKECLDPNAEPLEKRLPPVVAPSRFKLVEWIRRMRLEEQRREGPQTVLSFYGDLEHPKLFDYTNGLAFFIQSPPAEIEEAYEQTFLTLRGFKILCDQEGMVFCAVLFPQRFQVQPEDWKETVRVYGLNATCFDLGLPNRRIRDFCAANNISCIDPTERMKKIRLQTRRNLYGPGRDMHWNRFGQKALFDSIREDIEPVLRQGVLAREKRGRRNTEAP